MTGRVLAGLLLAWGLAASLPGVAPGAAPGGRSIEGVVRDQDGAPVPQAVVYLPEAGPAPIRGRLPRRAVMDQVARAFVPPALVVPVGAAVRFPNSDGIHHSVYSFSRANRFEMGLFKGQGGSVAFHRPGAVRIFCSIHKMMAGLVVVVEHPYAALTDGQGRFAIRDVPAGAHPVRAVHLFAAGVTQPVTVAAGPVRADFRLKVVLPVSPQEPSTY